MTGILGREAPAAQLEARRGERGFVVEPVVSRSFSMAKLLDMRLNALGSHPVSCSEYVAGLVQGRARHPRDGVHGFEPHRRRDGWWRQFFAAS